MKVIFYCRLCGDKEACIVLSPRRFIPPTEADQMFNITCKKCKKTKEAMP